MIATLRQRNFALLWAGGLISMAGDWMLYIALPIYVYQLTSSTLATSLMFIAETVPRILLGSVAGVFVDRWERKRTMVITNGLLALGLLPLLLVQSREWVWIVYLAGFVQATTEQFFSPAKNAMLPNLVPEEQLVSANALNALNNNLARLVGPALGGVIAGLLGLSGVILLDAASFVIAGTLIALITVTSQPSKDAPAAEVPSGLWLGVWREWVAGLRLIWRERVIATLMGMTAISAVGEGIMGVLFIVFVNRILHGGALEIGWLMSAQAVGGLLGGLVVGWVGRRVPPIPLLGASALLFGVIDLLIFNLPVLLPSLPLVIALFVLVGLPGIGFTTSLMALFQSRVADAYRGRIFGAYGTTLSLLGLVGMTFAGAMGDVLGPVPVLNVQGAGYVVVGGLAFLLLPLAVRAPRPLATETASPDPVGSVASAAD
jgi:MFS family permease